MEEVQDYVFACAQMVSPLLQGISNYIHPYVDLNSVDLLEDPVYIAGVINPIFR